MECQKILCNIYASNQAAYIADLYYTFDWLLGLQLGPSPTTPSNTGTNASGASGANSLYLWYFDIGETNHDILLVEMSQHITRNHMEVNPKATSW